MRPGRLACHHHGGLPQLPVGCGKAQHDPVVRQHFVGTELNPGLSYARVAEGCGLKGVEVATMEELTVAIREGCAAQQDGVTTFIEVLLNQELGEPFRRDAMKRPQIVAGIDDADMFSP